MKRAALAIALVLPFVVLPFATRRYAAHLGEQLARRAIALAPKPAAPPSALAPSPNLTQKPTGTAFAVPARHPQRDAEATGHAASPPSAPGSAAAPALAHARPRALFVPAHVVATLTPAHASSISGEPVDNGVRLHGVSALGFGLADGDVLESVAGAPTPSPDAAVAAITAAIGARPKRVSGVIRRAGERMTLTVELPVAMQGRLASP